MKLISVDPGQYVALQVIPDRTVRNYSQEVIVKGLAEFYSRPVQRMGWKGGLQYREQERIAFRAHFTKEQFAFSFLVPARLKDFFRQKIATSWEKATVKEVARSVDFSPTRTKAAELTYRKHDIFALKTDRDTNAPLESLLNAAADLGTGEQVLVDILLEPESRVEWEYHAEKAYEKFRKGVMPRRFDLTKANIIGAGLTGIDQGMNAINRQLLEATGAPKNKIKNVISAEVQLLNAAGLSPATTSKLHSQVVRAHIRILSQSPDPQRARINLYAACGAYKDLTGDNELVRRDVGNVRQLIEQVKACRVPAFKSAIIMSTAEAAKLIQLPTAGLQDDFPQIESIGQREVLLPAELFGTGITVGSVTRGGVTREARIPVHDHNILNLPHISLGAMGTGKTTQDAIMALGFLLHGFSAVAIDVADGKLIDQIRDGLPEGFPDDHIIDLDFGNLEYPIPLNWSEIARGLMSGARSIDARKAANRLSAQLVSFIQQLGHDSTPRMESYLTAAGKAVLGRPDNGLLEVILALTSETYREKLFEDGINNQQAIDTLGALQDAGDGMQQQIVGPILNRLNLLLGNEAMANCLLQRGNPAIDFRKWLDGDKDGPYFIGLRVPKDELLDIATDRLVAFLIAKVWLSVLSRYDQPEEQRRPCIMVMDEPHQFMSSKELWGDMVREARKWRLKLYWSAHNFRDFRSLGKTMKDAGCQYSVFRTSKETYHDLAEELLPFTLEDLIRIPDRFYAVNKVVLPGTANTPAFLAEMAPPPVRVKERSYRREVCSKKYGRHIDQVERDIYKRRQAYL